MGPATWQHNNKPKGGSLKDKNSSWAWKLSLWKDRSEMACIVWVAIGFGINHMESLDWPWLRDFILFCTLN